MKVNTEKLVHKDDREHFSSYINKQKLYEIFRKDETFHLNYRLVKNGKPVYYNLKATKGVGADDKYIVIGVRNVDAETKAHKKALAAAEQGEVYGQIAKALASRYEVLYYVDTETNEFDEFSTSEAYSHLDIGHHGYDFFAETQRNLVRDIHVDDYPMMATAMDKNYLLKEIRDKKVFSITYRLILDGDPQYVNLRALKPRGDDKHIVVDGFVTYFDVQFDDMDCDRFGNTRSVLRSRCDPGRTCVPSSQFSISRYFYNTFIGRFPFHLFIRGIGRRNRRFQTGSRSFDQRAIPGDSY